MSLIDIDVIRKSISSDTKVRNELVERYKTLVKRQRGLRNWVKLYESGESAPPEIRLEIFENRLCLNSYRIWIKALNKEINKLNRQLGVEQKSLNSHGKRKD